MKEPRLQNFDLLVQSIIGQRKHSILHNLRPFARREVYLQEQFLQLWKQSLAKKFKVAMKGAAMSFKMKLIDNPDRDVYQGTSSPGVQLKFKVQKDKEIPLILRLLEVTKSKNVNSDPFARWRGRINKDLSLHTQGKFDDFTLNTQIHVIGRVTLKEHKNLQNQENPEITQFQQNSWAGNIYVWFDFQRYKDQFERYKERTIGNASGEPFDIKSQAYDYSFYDDSSADSQQDFGTTYAVEDKIKIASFSMQVNPSDKMGVRGWGKSLFDGSIIDKAVGKIGAKIKRMTGIAAKDYKTDPDLIKRKFTLFGIDNPWVQVYSSVTIDDFFYLETDKVQGSYMNKNFKGARQITKLIKFPFDIQNLKDQFNPNKFRSGNQQDITKSNCWIFGKNVQSQNWPTSSKITKSKLLSSTSNHWITFRFQSWVRPNDTRFYFDYKLALNLTEYYQITNQISAKKTELADVDAKLAATPPPGAVEKRKLTARKKQLENQIIVLDKNKQFSDWIKWFIKQNAQQRTGQNIVIGKVMYDDQNKMVNVDRTIHNSMFDFSYRDPAAYKFCMNTLLNVDLMVQGQTLTSVMNQIHTP